MSKPNNVLAFSLKEYAKSHTEEAILTLVDVMRSGEKASDKIRASVELLNRGWGTPVQTIQVADKPVQDFDMTSLSTAELNTFHELLGKVARQSVAEVMPETEKTPENLKQALAVVPPRPNPESPVQEP